MTRRVDLPDDTLHSIDLIAKALAACITEQLAQATRMIDEAAKNTLPVRFTPFAMGQHEARLDQDLNAVFERLSIRSLGLRKPIVVNIGPFIKPGSRDASTTFVPGNSSLIPNKLLQRPNVVISKEASKDYADKLIKTVQRTVGDAVQYSKFGDVDVRNTFLREQKLHRQRHGMSVDEPCCIFKMIEEDYQEPNHTTKTELTKFEFNCTVCQGRHEIKVFR